MVLTGRQDLPIDRYKIIGDIEKATTLSSSDIKAALEGQSVRLGDFGSFRPTVSSIPYNTRKEVTVSGIKRVRVRFTPSAWLQHYVARDAGNVKFSMNGEIVEEAAPTAPRPLAAPSRLHG